MWHRLRQAFAARRAGNASSIGEVEHKGFYVYRVVMPDGPEEVISFVPPEQVMKEGLDTHAIIGSCPDVIEDERELVSRFRPNKAFIDLLHSVVAAYAPALPALHESARRQGSGGVVVIDGRTPTPNGTIPSRDVIGAFEVRNGTIVPDSYRPNSHHQLLSPDGIFQLEPTLYDRLLERIADSKPRMRQGNR